MVYIPELTSSEQNDRLKGLIIIPLTDQSIPPHHTANLPAQHRKLEIKGRWSSNKIQANRHQMEKSDSQIFFIYTQEQGRTTRNVHS